MHTHEYAVREARYYAGRFIGPHMHAYIVHTHARTHTNTLTFRPLEQIRNGTRDATRDTRDPGQRRRLTSFRCRRATAAPATPLGWGLSRFETNGAHTELLHTHTHTHTHAVI